MRKKEIGGTPESPEREELNSSKGRHVNRMNIGDIGNVTHSKS